MKRIAILLVLASSLQAQLLRVRSPLSVDDQPALRLLHRQLRASVALLLDFDGDGNLDALGGGTGATLHLGYGDAFFRRGWSTMVGRGRFLAGDVDGDGRLDFARAGSGNVGAELFLNDGARGFELVPGAFPVLAQPHALGDLDGDGDLDALATQTGLILLLTNVGGGIFAGTTLASATFSVRSIALGDVDGDGDLDALVGRSGQPLLFLNDGAGGFVDATVNVPQQSLSTQSVALGDLDQDGDLDAVLGNAGLDSLWLGGGDGTFVAVPAGLPQSSTWTHALGLIDIDSDGDLDVYMANGVNPLAPLPPFPTDVLLLNDGSASFQPTEPPVPNTGSGGALAGDADSDGDIDLIVGGGGLLLNDGAGEFWPDSGGVTGAAGGNPALADLDEDGWLDAVTVTFSDPGSPGFPFPALPGAHVLLGDGTGSFQEDPSWFASPVRSAVGVAPGDVDGDGDLDLMFANPWDGELGGRTQDNQLYRNDGGTFTNVSASALPVHVGDDRGVTLAVALADADEDGDLDLLLADANDFDGGGGGVTLYRNGGSGTFTDAGSHGVGDGALGLKVLDLEADGDPDLLVETHLFGLALLENDGTGAFADVSSRLPGANAYQDTIRWSVAADLDGDGDVDLAGVASVSQAGPFAFWYVNDGAGSFSDASSLIPQDLAQPQPIGQSPETFAPADLDGDGDLDLVGQRSLLENDGTGRLLHSRRPIESLGGSAAFADLDLDGDLDAFWGNAVSSNPNRHLASRGLPRIEKQLYLDVFGPASEAWLLSNSPDRVRIPLSIGLLQLDPATTSGVASGTLSPEGRATWSTVVPPTLLGSTLYWQALVGSQPRLTNAERTTFTAF